MAFIPFPEELVGGAIAVNAFAILCTLALVSVALRVIWLGVQSFMTRNPRKTQEYVFFNTQLGNYAACLLVGMIFNTVAGMMGLPWLIARGITEGSTCTAQGFLTQVGTWSSGFFTVTIAIHTFNTLVLKKRQSAIVSRATMTVGWVGSFLMASIPLFLPKPDGDIYGAVGFMCGVRAIYPKVQFFLHLLPILIASVLSAVFYSIIFLVLRGTLRIKGGIRLTLDPHERWGTVATSDHYDRFIARIARSMIWYPVAYVALLVPYSVMKLLEISGFAVPFEASVFAATCWFFLGVVNVALFYNTFRILEPAFDGTSLATSRRDLESSGMHDNGYSMSFRPVQARTLREKGPQSYRSTSTASEEQLLSSHEKGGQFGYGSTNVLSSPRPTLQKAEVLAHSPKSSVSSQGFEGLSQPFRVPLPSSPYLDLYSNSLPRTSPVQPSPQLSRPGSLTSSENGRFEFITPMQPSRSTSSSPSGRSPRSLPRPLTLVADRQSPSPRPSSRYNSPTVQRPLILPNLRRQRSIQDDDEYPSHAYVNPRVPPPTPRASR